MAQPALSRKAQKELSTLVKARDGIDDLVKARISAKPSLKDVYDELVSSGLLHEWSPVNQGGESIYVLDEAAERHARTIADGRRGKRMERLFQLTVSLIGVVLTGLLAHCAFNVPS